nr:unnamed protein product [Callosobruchus chinensis]
MAYLTKIIDTIGQRKLNIEYEHPGTNIGLVLMCGVGFWEQRLLDQFLRRCFECRKIFSVLK